MKHKSGYDGEDSMRAKAERLFGAAATGSMDETPSRTAPSKLPMRMYAKGGHVKSDASMQKHEAREKKLMRHMEHEVKEMRGMHPVHKAKGGSVTTEHGRMNGERKSKVAEGEMRPNIKKAIRSNDGHDHSVPNPYAKGKRHSEASRRFPVEMEDEMAHRERSRVPHLSETLQQKVGKARYPEEDVKTSEYKAVYKARGGSVKKKAEGGSVEKRMRVGSMMPKHTKGDDVGADLTDMHLPKKMNKALMSKGGKACYKSGGLVDPAGAYFPGRREDMKKGGRAKVTSPMRRAVKGRSKADMTTRKGQDLDQGSVQEISVPKKKGMLHPKPASNGSKHSKLNVENMREMNHLKKGGRC